MMSIMMNGSSSGSPFSIAGSPLGFESSSGEDQEAVWSLEQTLFAVAGAILSFVTIAGNVLVMVSFKLDKQLQTISNYFLLSLAGSLLLLLLF